MVLAKLNAVLRTYCLVALVTYVAVPACADEAARPVKLVFDTDLGNDVDDALAMGVIHALQARGQCELLAVTCTKDHPLCGPFADVINTFYGRPDIPLGTVRDGATRDEGKFLGLAGQRRGDAFRYPHDLVTGADAPDATELLRRVLAAQPDQSVVLVQVGFSTNLARLLKSSGDTHSALAGPELVRQKVRPVVDDGRRVSSDLRQRAAPGIQPGGGLAVGAAGASGVAYADCGQRLRGRCGRHVPAREPGAGLRLRR